MKSKLLFVLIMLFSIAMEVKAQQWTPFGGNLYNDPITTKVGIGIRPPQGPLFPNSLLHVNGDRQNDMFSLSYTDATSGTLWNNLTMGHKGGPYLSFNTQYRNGVEKLDIGSYGATAVQMRFSFNGLEFNSYSHPTNQQGAALPVWAQLTSNWVRTLTVRPNGKVSIGEKHIVSGPNANYKLSIHGLMVAQGVNITNALWADYVFQHDYELLSFDKLESFINENGHLPNIPSESEITKNGLDVAEITTLQMEKIEELTLYILQLNKQLEVLKKEVELLKSTKDEK